MVLTGERHDELLPATSATTGICLTSVASRIRLCRGLCGAHHSPFDRSRARLPAPSERIAVAAASRHFRRTRIGPRIGWVSRQLLLRVLAGRTEPLCIATVGGTETIALFQRAHPTSPLNPQLYPTIKTYLVALLMKQTRYHGLLTSRAACHFWITTFVEFPRAFRTRLKIGAAHQKYF